MLEYFVVELGPRVGEALDLENAEGEDQAMATIEWRCIWARFHRRGLRLVHTEEGFITLAPRPSA